MTEKGIALITGASSGIGAVYARRLAELGHDLILVARREEKLRELCAELSAKHSIQAEPLAADLASDEGMELVERRILACPEISWLVNNAGFGTTGRFVRKDLATQIAMIRLHVIATVRLTHAALPAMIERKRGSVVNVSSVAAWLVRMGNANYSATKAYLNSFSETLAVELEGTGVRVQALCPGFTYSGFHDTEEYRRFERARLPRWAWMTAESVVEASLSALRRNKVIAIAGFRNRIFLACFRSRRIFSFLERHFLKNGKDAGI